MIKKEKIDKYIGDIMWKVMLIVVGIIFIWFAFEPPQIFEISLSVFIVGILLIIFPLISIIETVEGVDYPENFVDCKKCKKIIRKKHIFCSDCRMDIRKAIRHKEDKKYFKDYKKFYKDKKK